MRSPRLRRQGSIPACAGEPGRGCPDFRRGVVYPRVCGGTELAGSSVEITPGLSPRVRGNRVPLLLLLLLFRGSIPACAGEPPSAAEAAANSGVYPRVCGGTIRWLMPQGQGGGLSPRVRGNQLVGDVRIIVRGSIPACAGEPMRKQTSSSLRPVYPRVCGGTRRRLWDAWCVEGLSPRVRGNQQ